jgi:uncharacterized protein YqeY
MADDTLESRLTADMKTAMKAGDKKRLGVIRMLLSDVKNADMNKTTPEKAVASFASGARKAAETYRKHDDEARAAESDFEVSVAAEYLPKKMDETETAAKIDAFLADQSFGPSDAGRATGTFMKQHGQDADAALVNKLMRQKLSA